MKANSISRSTQVEVRVAKTLFIMVSIFTSSMLPFLISSFWQLLDPSLNTADLKNFSHSKYRAFKGFSHVANVVLFYNSLWNFFIYQHRDRDFKRSLKLLKKRVMIRIGVDYKKGISPKRTTVQHSHSSPHSRTAVTDFRSPMKVTTVM